MVKAKIEDIPVKIITASKVSFPSDAEEAKKRAIEDVDERDKKKFEHANVRWEFLRRNEDFRASFETCNSMSQEMWQEIIQWDAFPSYDAKEKNSFIKFIGQWLFKPYIRGASQGCFIVHLYNIGLPPI